MAQRAALLWYFFILVADSITIESATRVVASAVLLVYVLVLLVNVERKKRKVQNVEYFKAGLM